MAINNLNPRRVVWFSPNEPSNKYDIWLSKNAHLDENGESTTDSNSQRDCDYIFKIYDCGKWNPIVGFNSTAANKIDIVEGNTLYHPAIFTGENPNDLYDAGTLGELLANTNFVTQPEWENLFNTTQFIDAFNNVIVNGDEYDWETLIQNIISGGNIEIPFATTSIRGGIYADTFGVMANAFKPVEVKFYPPSYSSLDHRLCVNAGDIITQINEWQNDNPTQPGINAGGNIELATYNKIGGIHAYADSDTQDTRGVPVMFGGPLVGLTYGGNVPDNQIIYGDFEQYNPDNSFLYVPGWAIREVLKNDLSDDTSTQWDLNVLANYGVDVTKFNITLPDLTQLTAMYFYTLNNYPTNKQGYVPITKWYNSGTYGYTYGFEWLEPNLDFLSDVEINNPTQGQSLVYDGSKWINGNTSGTEDTWRPIQVNDQPIASDYTFDIHSGIGITFSTAQSNREAVCKIELNVQYSNESNAPTLTGDLIVQAIPVNTSYPHGGCLIEGTYSGSTGNHYLTGPYICRTVLYNVTSASKISFNVAQTPSLFDGNPVYYKLKITGDTTNVSITFVEGSEYIVCDDAVVSGHLNAKFNNYFITIQFGIVKIEPIMIQQSI